MPQNQSPTNKVKRWALGKSSLKFGHSDKATKIWNNLPLDLILLSKRQIICEIVSNCVDFLENLNFNSYLNTVSPYTVSSLENVFFSDFGLHALICTQRISKGRSCEKFCFISNLQRYIVLAKDSLSFFSLDMGVKLLY